ncbi:MAG: cell division protein FtsA, partial [Deinococcales bacterium]|nr:cell division protein FtsA [Chitinophagaceae bacterium]
LNARIGLPNEHLAPNHIDELKKPMYATCIGLILKGYSDYEHQYKQFSDTFKRVEVPKVLKADIVAEVTTQEPVIAAVEKAIIKERNKLKFWDKFKDNLIDLFKEEEDKIIK